MSPSQAVILGVVEGITEFLPVSSTGHLILAGQLLGLRDPGHFTASQMDALQAYEIVIQAGAILAVAIIYRERVVRMLMGLVGRSTAGFRLARNIVIAFIPAAAMGLTIKGLVREYLQFTGPVIAALASGGVFMIWFARSRRARKSAVDGLGIEDLSPRQALLIGFSQCFALWPGMSRSMVTIVGGIGAGLSPFAATEFSFLLGLPTLLAATAYKGLKEGHSLMEHIGAVPIAIGLGVSAVCAAVTVKWMIAYLGRMGLVWFGWYRIAVAVAMLSYLGATASAG